MAIYPGAVFKPTPHGGRVPRNRQGRGIYHVAVSRARSLEPWNENTWHFFVAEDGYCEQYVDTDFRAFADVTANDDAIAIETAGGTGPAAQVESELWTPAQADRLADITKWVEDTEGTPFVLMPDSRPIHRGWAPHRWGIDPWRVPGGEVWSGSRGKLCPGSAKVGQIPAILELARQKDGQAPAGPQPVPPPVVHPAAPARLGWNLPAGHYYGNWRGPERQHGGYYSKERGFVANIQAWLVYHGCVPGVTDWQASGWDDGRWEAPTDAAMSTWHARFYPGQPQPAQCWSDDYDRLARP